MTFSLSTMCTHTVLCSLMLLATWLLFCNPSRLGRLGGSVLTLSSVLLSIRLLLPFEWRFTKTFSIPGFYFHIIDLLNTPVFNRHSFSLTLYQLLLIVAVSVSVVRILRLFAVQRMHLKYLDALPESSDLIYIDRFRRRRKVRCMIDPASANAYTVGLLRPRIVMPVLPLTDKERRFILNHELSHIQTGDLWIKFFTEMICTCYWWIPWIGLLRQETTAALEFRADRRTTENLDEDEKTKYLECLLKVAIAHWQKDPALAVGLTSHRIGSLQDRFRLVIAPPKCKPLSYAVAILLSIVTMLSALVVFEPYGVPESVRAVSFRINTSASFVVRREDQGYELYMDGISAGRFQNMSDDLQQLPIFDSLEEAETCETFGKNGSRSY